MRGKKRIFKRFFRFAILVYSCQRGGGCDRARASIVWGARFLEAGGVFSERRAAAWNRETERERGPSVASASERKAN